jgi:tetratricopeptide (TPR) repeat protein
VCNRGALIITLQRSQAPVPELRSLLIGNRDPETCFLAAYNIARAYEIAKEHRKALFYAQLACDRGDQLGRPAWRSWSRNQLGNALLSLSYLGEAEAEYRLALELLPEDLCAWRAVMLQNLGYTMVASGRSRTGLSLLLRAWRLATRDQGAASALLHLDLAYSYLEVGKARTALRHALRGLCLAERAGFVDEIKNARFLAAEAYRAVGDADARERQLEALRPFFADAPFVADLLRAADWRPLINLRA